MQIIELVGPICSGKTMVRRSFPEIPGWDIKDDFYLTRGILNGASGEMNWLAFEREMPKMTDEVFAAIKKAEEIGSPFFFIEHSGTGQWMANVMDKVIKQYVVKRIAMSPPSLCQLKRRCKKTGMSFESARAFNARKDWKGVSVRQAVRQIHKMEEG